MLLQCKTLLDKGLELSLRDALGKVLYNKDYDDSKPYAYNDTPWYLRPLPKANPKSHEFIRIGKKAIDRWIKQ